MYIYIYIYIYIYVYIYINGRRIMCVITIFSLYNMEVNCLMLHLYDR